MRNFWMRNLEFLEPHFNLSRWQAFWQQNLDQKITWPKCHQNFKFVFWSPQTSQDASEPKMTSLQRPLPWGGGSFDMVLKHVQTVCKVGSLGLCDYLLCFEINFPSTSFGVTICFEINFPLTFLLCSILPKKTMPRENMKSDILKAFRFLQ